MKTTFNQHIGIFENAAPKEWCQNIINFFENNPENQINRQDAENIIGLSKSDNHLTTKVQGEEYNKYFNDFCGNFWDKIYPKYNNKYTADTSPIQQPKFISGFKIQRTQPTEGYHVWHYESEGGRFCHRLLAYSVYLNDVEEGGETEFLYQSLRVKPTQGTVILWPASFTHIHRGNPPISNTKYLITGWIDWSENHPQN